MVTLCWFAIVCVPSVCFYAFARTSSHHSCLIPLLSLTSLYLAVVLSLCRSSLISCRLSFELLRLLLSSCYFVHDLAAIYHVMF